MERRDRGRQVELFEEVARLTRAADALAGRGFDEESLPLYRQALNRLSEPPAPGEASPGDGATIDELRATIAQLSRRSLSDLVAGTERGRRRAIVVGSAVGIVVLAAALLSSLWHEADIGVGARWTASSGWQKTASAGRLTRFGLFDRREAFFFHTVNEKAPHLDVDLGAVRIVAGVDVENATHCCYARALGLTVSVSTDGARFRDVAQRDTESVFRRWSPRFAGQKARYVRFSLTRADYLHLSAVRVFGS